LDELSTILKGRPRGLLLSSALVKLCRAFICHQAVSDALVSGVALAMGIETTESVLAHQAL
jgi:hypothetical protein